MENGENKVKSFVKNNFLYFIIAFACVAYIAYGFINITESGKTIIEIVGQGAVIILFGYAITYLFSMQGMLSGDKKKEVADTNELHSKCVKEIDPKINLMDGWCEIQNANALKSVRRSILNAVGLSYDECFDEDGIVKPIEFDFKEKPSKDIGSNEKYKMELKKVKRYNNEQRARARALRKAVRVKITLLTTDSITATNIKNKDPHNLGMDRRTYQKMEASSGLLSKIIIAVVFSYFTVNFLFGYEYLISSLIQVGIFLLMGGIKWVQSYYFVIETLRKRTVRQINYIKRFKCDMKIDDKEESKKENCNNVEVINK